MKDPRIYIIHIRDCLDRIKRYTADGQDNFFIDLKTQDAVLRNLETMADATGKLPEQWKATHPEVDWRRIVNFRNFLAHQYLEVQLEVVWQVIDQELAPLEVAIEDIARRFWDV